MSVEQLQCESCGAVSSVPVPDDGTETVWECAARIAPPEGSPEGTADSACDHMNLVPGSAVAGDVIVAPGERSHEEARAVGEAGHPAVRAESVPIVTVVDDDSGTGSDHHKS